MKVKRRLGERQEGVKKDKEKERKDKEKKAIGMIGIKVKRRV